MDRKQTSPVPAELLPAPAEPASVSPPPRKRQIDSGSDADDKPRLKRARLTRRNLARFTKMGKDEKKKSSSSQRESTSGSQKSKTTSTTTPGFAVQAYENGILPPLLSKPPTNLEDIQKRHAKSRETASPPEAKYKQYVNSVGKAGNGATMVVETSRHLLKEYDDDEGYNRSFDRLFTGLPAGVGFNDGLSAPQPDFVEGLELDQFGPFPIRKQIDGAVLYEDDLYSPALPHVAGEWKGRGENMEEARLQSSYDGAALVYARNQALSYMANPDSPGHAEVTTFTTDGTTLNQFAHYAEQSEDGTKYHQYRVKSTNLIDSYEDFKDGRRSLRNAQDHARNQSYAMRDDLKEHWKQQRNTRQPVTEKTSLIPDSQANLYDTGTYETTETTLHLQASHGADTQETTQQENESGHKVVDQPYSTHQSPLKHSSNH